MIITIHESPINSMSEINEFSWILHHNNQHFHRKFEKKAIVSKYSGWKLIDIIKINTVCQNVRINFRLHLAYQTNNLSYFFRCVYCVLACAHSQPKCRERITVNPDKSLEIIFKNFGTVNRCWYRKTFERISKAQQILSNISDWKTRWNPIHNQKSVQLSLMKLSSLKYSVLMFECTRCTVCMHCTLRQWINDSGHFVRMKKEISLKSVSVSRF